MQRLEGSKLAICLSSLRRQRIMCCRAVPMENIFSLAFSWQISQASGIPEHENKSKEPTRKQKRSNGAIEKTASGGVPDGAWISIRNLTPEENPP